MESAERRNEQQRIDVNRPIELIGVAKDENATGYTRNLSADGVRALVDEAPDANANVLVRLSLVDGQAPVDKPGRIVWCAPDIYGEGTDVGIHLGEQDAEAESAEEPAEAPAAPNRDPIVPAPLLNQGQTVEIETAGIAVEARVDSIGEIDDAGRIQVQLVLVEEQVPELAAIEAADPEPIFDTEEWTPHPFRDAWRTARRFLGPLLTALSVVGHFSARLIGWLWRKTPARPRTRVEALWRRVALPRRFRSVGSRLGAAHRWFTDQLAGWRASRSAKRSGETSA